MFLLLTLFVSDKTTQLVNEALRVLAYNSRRAPDTLSLILLVLSLTLREVCKRNDPRFREKQKNPMQLSYKLSLNLFVFWSLAGIFTNNPDFPAPAHNLALGTNFFYRGSYFHNIFTAVE